MVIVTEKLTPAPSGLSPAARKLWRDVQKGQHLRPDQLRILEDACMEADLIDSLQEGLTDAPTTVKGSMGQEVIHPLISELRQHRSALTALLRALSLADTDTSATDAKRATRESATALARARWGNKGA
jgi:hypothetical protein